MNIRVFTGGRQLYTTFLVSITLCIVLTLLVCSSVFYVNYSGAGLTQAFQSDLNSLTQTSREVVGMRDSAQSLSFQMYRNSVISKLLYYEQPHIYDVTGAMGELNNYLNSMPFIESIVVYNSRSDMFYIAAREGQSGVYSRQELADKGLLEILDRYESIQPFTPVPRAYSLNTDDSSGMNENASVYTFLCYDAIGSDQELNSAVAVNISAAWINRDMAIGADPEQAGRTYILDDQGRFLSADTLQPPDWPALEAEQLRSQVEESRSGYLTADFGGTHSLISYTKQDPLGWRYVRVTPYSQVTEQLSTVRNTTLAIAAAILLGGLLLSWGLSRFLYGPIRGLVSRMNSLETQQRNNLQTVQQNALRNLLLGVRTLATDTQLASLGAIGISFQFREDYRLVLLQIDRFRELRERRGSDLSLYQFAVMNISSEIFSALGGVQSVDMGEGRIAVLVNPSGAGDEAPFLELLPRIQQACREYLSIGVTITYSPVTNDPLHLHPLYEQVREASLHRMFCGQGCLIDSEEVVALKSREYLYPMDQEKRLVDAIMAGHMDDAKEIFTGMLQETRHYPIHVLQLAVSHLTMTINHVIFTIQKNGALEFEGGLESYMPSGDYETLEEMTNSFCAFLDEIKGRMVEKRSLKQENLINQINRLIQRHYADPNLCLNWIAGQLDMSSIYISRVYKQHTLNAIVDVINDVRLDRARELLERSEASVAEIAEQTGYTSSSYFHRMFKKRLGITPAEYRRARTLSSSS